MVKASKGESSRECKGSSDPAVKQIILNLNDKSKFIVQDLDLQHILVSPDSVQSIKYELENEVCRTVHRTSAV
ncbi:hypothetical protein E3Q22_01367 [Wallemia mellicola]|uniref:General transcription and DNA repair factor IIH subunit TFB5 n=2 Tax=Wallemia mellicola TaxID=1708541 RepID=A0A4T0PZS2_9BASI|nr:hypothetical protein E3Q22_01367 [Wallemia mellicola]TIB90552.1 hypothetical protein E3Q19_02733 [Wallemia mellicola]TIB95933.1 hypothetical protein E3Q18_03406 [Wallemia mellicola]TIB98926.1 hypothetical protein E3Q17_02815 [Wallemia mellicola]TIC16128.1 hypothetical protein E3Q14_00086 [Wallemia mellicola]